MPIDFSRVRLSRLAAVSMVSALALTAAGCTSGKGPLLLGPDPNWGEANRQTMAAQIIDPAPRYDTEVAEGNGEQTAKAIERYRTDKVKKPDRIRTSTAGSGAGSGGGGAGMSSN